MPRDFQLYLKDIKHSCEKIIKFTTGVSLDQFMMNELIYDAVLRNLMIIGEAAKNIPEYIRIKFPHIEWKKISGFRDIIAHAYFGIDNTILWDIIQFKIPALLRSIEK